MRDERTIVFPPARPASLPERVGFNPRARARGLRRFEGTAAALGAVPAAEARAQLPAQIAAALDAPVGEVRIIAADAGAGKSHALIDALVERKLAERRALAPGEAHKTTLLLLPNKALAEEWAKDVDEGGKIDWRGVRRAVLRGKDKTNCRNYAVVAPLQAVGARVSAICGSIDDEEAGERKHNRHLEARRPSDPVVIVAKTQALADALAEQDERGADAFANILTAEEQKHDGANLVLVEEMAGPEELTKLAVGLRFARRRDREEIAFAIAPDLAIGSLPEVEDAARRARCAIVIRETPAPRSRHGRAEAGWTGEAFLGYTPPPRETVLCPFRDWCNESGYHAQATQVAEAEIIISNHAWLSINHATSFLAKVERLETIIIDESPLGSVVNSGEVAVEDLLAPLDVKAPGVIHRLLMLIDAERSSGETKDAYRARVAQIRDEVATLDRARRDLAEQIARDVEEGRDPALQIVRRGQDVPQEGATRSVLDGVISVLAAFRGRVEERIGPSMTVAEAEEVAELYNETKIVGKNRTLFSIIRRRAQLIRGLSKTLDAAALDQVFARDTSLSFSRHAGGEDGKPIRHLRYDWVSPTFISNIEGDLEGGEDGEPVRTEARVVILDASAHAEIYERLFPGRKVSLSRTRMTWPNTQVLQFVDSTFSNTALLGRPDPGRLDPEGMKAAGELATKAIRLIDRLAAKHPKGLLVCATQGVIEMVEGAFAAAGCVVPGNIGFLGYGKARGTNQFEAFEAVLCLGRIQPPKDVVERKAGALEAFRAAVKAEAPAPLALDEGPTFPLRPGLYRRRDGSLWEKAVPLPTDGLVGAVLATHREDEVAQAAARLRPATRPVERPATIYLGTSLPIDVELDDILVLDDLIGGETPLAQLFRIFDGVLPLSPKLAARRAKGSMIEARAGYRRLQALYAAAGLVTRDFAGESDRLYEALQRTAPLDRNGVPLLHVVQARHAKQPGSASVLLVAATVPNVWEAVAGFYAACGLELGACEVRYSPPDAEIVQIPQPVAEAAARSREPFAAARDTGLSRRLAKAYEKYLGAKPRQAAAMGAAQAHHTRRGNPGRLVCGPLPPPDPAEAAAPAATLGEAMSLVVRHGSAEIATVVLLSVIAEETAQFLASLKIPAGPRPDRRTAMAEAYRNWRAVGDF